MIGKLEELTLLGLIRAGNDSLANDIFVRVAEGQKGAAFGAVYTTLTRMTKKKFVKERQVTDDSGRERRAFTITDGGRAALAEALTATARVGGWEQGGEYGNLAF